jgi:hypothetical protein
MRLAKRGKASLRSETEKVVVKPEPQPPFTFAYTFDPPKPDSQTARFPTC